MELEAAAWIPLAVALALFFLLVGWLARGPRVRRQSAALSNLIDQLELARAERDEIVERYRDDLTTSRALGAGAQESPDEAGSATTHPSLRYGLADVVGLEAEVIALRSIAARTRELEGRLARLAPPSDTEIDLRSEMERAKG